MINAAFWKAAFERLIKTFAQTLAATLGAGAINILEVPWQAALSIAAGAAVVSLLTSVASAGAASPGPALFGPETVR
jgi:hypothetical protein